MSKKWANRNKLNPVFYVQKNSIIADQLKPLLDNLKSQNSGDKLNPNNNVIQFSKSDEGKSPKEENKKYYRFYNEREWRYVPQSDINVNGKNFSVVV